MRVCVGDVVALRLAMLISLFVSVNTDVCKAGEYQGCIAKEECALRRQGSTNIALGSHWTVKVSTSRLYATFTRNKFRVADESSVWARPASYYVNVTKNRFLLSPFPIHQDNIFEISNNHRTID